MELEQINIHNHSIDELRKKGIYPIASLKLFDEVKNLVIYDYCIERELEILDKYIEYINNIYSLKETVQEKYLNSIKVQEVMDTQLLEKEDSYLLALYLMTKKECAMDYFFNDPLSMDITRNKIINAHKRLLEGTSSSEYATKDYRTDNNAFVAICQDGNVKIRYFTIDFKDIETAINNLTVYYNGNLHNQYTLIKPILIHGLVGAIQLFDDGNTRLGRMLQNIKIYELTNKNLDINLSLPALYNSRSYKDYRTQYREKLGAMVVEPGEETWNKWINFNLNRIEDQIYYANSKLNEYKRAIR